MKKMGRVKSKVLFLKALKVKIWEKLFMIQTTKFIKSILKTLVG